MGFSALSVRFFQRQSINVVNAAEYDTSSSALKRLGSHQALSLKLATAENRLEELEILFPPKLSGPSTVSRLIRMAERSALSVTDVQTQPGTDEEVGENYYRRMSIEIQMQGTLSSLKFFLEELENGAIPASRIDHLNIDKITPSVLPDGTPEYTLEVGLLLSLFSRDPSEEPAGLDTTASATGGGS